MSNAEDDTPSNSNGWFEVELLILILLVTVTYFGRLTMVSLRGEETRRALVAAEILDTGDWIVPRQQGTIYLSRPPAGSWTIAALAMLRGKLDVWAIRLPSAIAMLLTTLLVYRIRPQLFGTSRGVGLGVRLCDDGASAATGTAGGN